VTSLLIAIDVMTLGQSTNTIPISSQLDPVRSISIRYLLPKQIHPSTGIKRLAYTKYFRSVAF
jgi:hypothetical protein